MLLLQKSTPVDILEAVNVYQEVVICKTWYRHFSFRLCHVINNTLIKIVVLTYLEKQEIFSASFANHTWNVKPHFIHSHKNGKTFLFVLVTMLCFEITVSLAKAISKYFCIFVVVNKVSVYFLYKYVLHSVVSISIRILNYFIFLHNSGLIKRTMFFSLSERKHIFWIRLTDNL